MGTRLVTELGGSETAKLMFFNGTSMSPDGPIEYLPNPNLRENLAFSFQMQLLADGKYPGLMRKIYLKGLRYNEACPGALRPDRGGRADKHIRGGEGGDGAACRYPGSCVGSWTGD